jgi:transcription initiation factor TFIIIB Brf1 subunit/transcription initiation factor TFIIB
MGSKEITADERQSKGVGGNGSTYEYLKVVSDSAGRNEGTPAICARMIERIGEKLLLPKVVRLEAQSIAKKVLALPHPHRRLATAAVSAYALIAACKLEFVTSVSVREIVEAHVALGRQVSSSSIIKLTLDSPIKTYARRPEDYLTRIVARLNMNRKLLEQLAKDGVRQTEYANCLRETASELLESISQDSRAGRRPCALAGSAVYSAELVISRVESRKRRLTQRELAECGDTAEYTVREQCANVFAPAVEELVRRRIQPRLLQEAR